jgi:hypothetical protein
MATMGTRLSAAAAVGDDLITIDSGPYSAVVVCWRGRCVTVLGGTRAPAEGAPGEERPVKVPGEERPVKVPTPVGPPTVARLQMSVADALERAPGEGVPVGSGADIPEEHFLWAPDEAEEERIAVAAVPSENPQTIQITLEGANVVDLDRYQAVIDDAQRSGSSILIRFT